MSHPSQDPQAYPWGRASGDRPQQPDDAAAVPAPGTQPSSPPPGEQERDPYAGQQEQQPYQGEPYQGQPYEGRPYRAEQPSEGSGYQGQPYGGGAVSGYAGSPAPAPGEGGQVPTSTVVLLVLSGLAAFSGLLSLAGIPALVLAVVALTRARTDPASTRRLTRIGWILLVGITLLLVLLGIGLAALLIGLGTASDPFGPTRPDFDGIAALLTPLGP